ncbi:MULTISPECIES: DUF1877 family protein [Arthrobacter]|uniref:DUF1877 family protein n=2 Tax=Arthrobacter TaxID=1663 RepID=A0ABU9KK11_9MICC|nr:DUF1877 family protein [Arthrobacter sp. YJM1]MDP5227093.1 DUF1877 family protein [Arthrobacter sp. YJM1]
MGIRYYAYAFNADATEWILADPRRGMSADPLADAWGFEPGSAGGPASMEQTSSERDMLYLDKAWGGLQRLTGPESGGGIARPSHRMFEGQVVMHHDGWEACVRAVPPADVAAIAEDLRELLDEVAPDVDDETPSESLEYHLYYLRQAEKFVSALADEGRGFVYEIG